MTTVLLWGEQWWVPGQPAPIPFTGRSQAAPALARSWGAGARSLRLVFEPDDFVSTPANCPNTSKALLGAALAEDFPSLGHPAIAWGHEPILAAGENFNTVLHHEGQPWLKSLVAELESLGFSVACAVPMIAWLSALPEDLTESGAITLFAVQPERFCLYRHSTGGERTTLKRCGPDAQSTLVTHLRSLMRNRAGEFIFGVVRSAEELAAIELALGLEPEQWAGGLTVAMALEREALVPPKHPARLLPPKPFVTAARAITAATLLLMLAVALGAVHYVRLELRARSVAAVRAFLKEDLQRSVAQLRANQAEAGLLRAEIASLAEPAPRVAGFIRKLGSSVPPEILLTEFRIEGASVTLRGFAKSNSTEGWAKGIAHAKFAAEPNGSFTVEGTMP